MKLKEYQELVRELVRQRGFEDETPHEVLALLVEEVGELSKALRKQKGLKTNAASKEHSLYEEAADVFFMLIDFCNRTGIDLEEAFEAKESKNRKREWK